mmetsp:Transcript_19521/g.29373  ORF Transcript_19521/g.29373 Transcript_19521/m.29373 type:complete len:511 (+) Transcript_19521:48-1580(+)
MNRNTSFFWAADDLRVVEENDDSVVLGIDIDDDDRDNNKGVSIPIGESHSTSIDYDARPPDAIPLINSTKGSETANRVRPYGSTTNDLNHNVSRAREETKKAFPIQRTVFPHQAKGSPSRSLRKRAPKGLRFQAVIWHIGNIDVQLGQVTMRFRLTLYWNDEKYDEDQLEFPHGTPPSPNTRKKAQERIKYSNTMWVMEGRQCACRKQMTNQNSILEMVDVPPVSILNAVHFDTVGAPEVCMLDEEERLLRWTCMYNAVLTQGDHMFVGNFPHDSHLLELRLGVLCDRGKGRRWDHTVYPLMLATEADSQGSSRIPCGMIVDHVRVPDFVFDANHLRFEMLPMLSFGGHSCNKQPSHSTTSCDTFLQITLPVVRESCQFDRSIFPILIALNIIAVSCMPRNFGSPTASTETMLSIAFVQVGIRLTVDSRLPGVGYQIKMQQVMNQCFWLICGLVLESNIVFFLVVKLNFDESDLPIFVLDIGTAIAALLYNFRITRMYWKDKPSSPSLTK